MDKAAPAGFHATSIYPEYFKVGGNWYLAEDSRMDSVPFFENGQIFEREFINLKKGEQDVVGRSEEC